MSLGSTASYQQIKFCLDKLRHAFSGVECHFWPTDNMTCRITFQNRTLAMWAFHLLFLARCIRATRRRRRCPVACPVGFFYCRSPAQSRFLRKARLETSVSKAFASEISFFESLPSLWYIVQAGFIKGVDYPLPNCSTCSVLECAVSSDCDQLLAEVLGVVVLLSMSCCCCVFKLVGEITVTTPARTTSAQELPYSCRKTSSHCL